MATRVYETIELELLDGRTILVKPLNLKNLRSVMKEWQEAQNAENEDEFLDVLIKCTSIAMTQLDPSIAENIDEVMDLQTMYKVLEIAADIKLNVPNQIAAIQAQVGTN
jgi:hypothetical protein